MTSSPATPISEYDLRVVDYPALDFPEGAALVSRLELPDKVYLSGWYHSEGNFSGLWVYPFSYLEAAKEGLGYVRETLAAASDVEVSDR